MVALLGIELGSHIHDPGMLTALTPSRHSHNLVFNFVGKLKQLTYFKSKIALNLTSKFVKLKTGRDIYVVKCIGCIIVHF